MTYRIEISSVAEAEADSAFMRLSQVASLDRASQWHSGLLSAIESLSTMPKRCPLAKENEISARRFGNSSTGKNVTRTASYSLS